MSDESTDPQGHQGLRDELALPDELPPVEPPSAGMIVQLFLIPALIVGVIIGVYVLFGQIASQELNWRQLVTDVRSENPHVRWRGALGLAQMLDADVRRGEESQNLPDNPEIAGALAELYGDLVTVSNPSEEETKQIEFLSKALGRMSPAEVVMPVFQTGIQPDRDPEIRKHSLLGLAMHLGVLRENGHVDVPSELFSDLLNISREQVAISRHQTAYIFGLIGSPEAVDRLEVMVEDPDQMVRVNAAIGFARNESTQGLPVFHELFEEAASWELNPSKVESDKEESLYFERMLMVVNSIKAVTKLSSSLSPEEKARFVEELQTLSDSTRDSVLRTDALAAIQELS